MLYLLGCNKCPLLYIGETDRTLKAGLIDGRMKHWYESDGLFSEKMIRLDDTLLNRGDQRWWWVTQFKNLLYSLYHQLGNPIEEAKQCDILG